MAPTQRRSKAAAKVVTPERKRIPGEHDMTMRMRMRLHRSTPPKEGKCAHCNVLHKAEYMSKNLRIALGWGKRGKIRGGYNQDYGRYTMFVSDD